MDSIQSLRYIINHVFLPPKLPHEDDGDASSDRVLLEECETALRIFRQHVSRGKQRRLSVCARAFRKMSKMREASGDMAEEAVEDSFGLDRNGEIIAFHIRAQNAGLIVRKMPEHFSFESFELSPTTEPVLQSGRLQRCFPGPAIAVSKDKMDDPTLCEALMQLITQLDTNTPNEAWPVTVKAQSKSPEIRDTIHPKFATEFLTGILRGIGTPLNVKRIHKRTRDDVVWKDAKLPWRRSPLWLLLRVTLQTTLMVEGQKNSHMDYKSFMVFFMSRILDLALAARLPSDILYVMAAKISRRVLKLGIEDQPSWIHYVCERVEATHGVLFARWNMLEQDPDPFGAQKGWHSCKFSSSDTSLSLHNLQPYLQSLNARRAISPDQLEFQPQCSRRIIQNFSAFPETALVTHGQDPAARLTLADIEFWTQHHLTAWLVANQHSTESCNTIAEMIMCYTTAAASTYADCPEDLSLMFLTAIELWVALDKCAIHQSPLLCDYDPGFPLSLFDSLLLPKRDQMEQLSHVEDYLKARKQRATLSSSFIFESGNSTRSLAVRYYEQSSTHQSLRHGIEDAAQLRRESKKAELKAKRREYNKLMQEADRLSCDFGPRTKRGKVPHLPSCEKCRLKSTASRIHIFVHEWPLPKNELDLDGGTPHTVYLWTLFHPVNPSFWEAQKKKVYRMEAVDGLEQYIRSKSTRVRLASATKPFTQAHYGMKLINQATEENICVNNGMCYSMYDNNRETWTRELSPGQCDIRQQCTIQLPKGPFEKLQFVLDKTTHSSNEILAMQSECSKSLSLHEFYDFATLRSGDLLQWRNIARQLAHRTINFNREETYMLVKQAAWQVGRAGNMVCRESHMDLEEQEFGISLLSVLEEALETVEGNWQNAAALRIFVILALRLLSMTIWDVVRDRCFLFLQRARHSALKWTREIRRLHADAQETELEILNLKVLEMALTCHSTFDVDERYLPKILQSDDDVTVVTECSVIIYDHCPTVMDGLPLNIMTLLQRFWRISHRLELKIRTRILTNRCCIDRTVQRMWNGYQPGTAWTALTSPNQRWLTSRTSNKDGYKSKTVHYNVLNGLLLINGARLTRLDPEYEKHATYRRLFGKKVLNIVPSSMEGMIYEAQREICGHQVHFAMYKSELIIRTRKRNNICELIPMHVLQDDFPKLFVETYVYWHDMDTSSIELRPLTSPWTSSPENWRIQVGEVGRRVLRNTSEELIDIRSSTATTIARTLSSLEQPNNIYIVINKGTRMTHVHLPRLKLEFFLRNNEERLLESKQFRNMVVDENQSIGTFTGLVNKLVLRKVGESSRTVIIPYGTIRFSQEHYHTRVTIDTASASQVRYHSYRIDNQLGRLVDNGSLQSRLFRLYLHALTYHCLTDKLTGRTGTEEALHGLVGAATFSFIRLDSVDIELLGLLAQLTPIRQYYPEHLKVMQQVDWLGLSPLSQHPDFHKNVSLVFEEYPKQLPVLKSCGDTWLQKRSAIHDSSFRIHGFGAEYFTTGYDKVYSSRDFNIDSAREIRTCHTARLVDEWSTALSVSPNLLSEIESWNEEIQGYDADNNLIGGFDLMWLEPPAKVFPENWSHLHDLLCFNDPKEDKYEIMILLSTLSYSQYAKQDFIHTLLAFATVPRLRSICGPKDSSFQLSEGYQPEIHELTTLVKGHAKKFHQCPEANLPALSDEDEDEADDRRRELHENASQLKIQSFWPTTSLSRPGNGSYDTYISVNQAIKNANIRFKSWYRNAKFRSFIQEVQSVLNDIPASTRDFEPYSFLLPVDRYTPSKEHLDLGDMMNKPAPHLPTREEGAFHHWVTRQPRNGTNRMKLEEVLSSISSRASTEHEKTYVSDLQNSFEALNEDETATADLPCEYTALLDSNLNQAKHHTTHLYNLIHDQLFDGICSLLHTMRMLPRVSPAIILSTLSKDKIGLIPDAWRNVFIEYGLSIAALQRAERLVACSKNKVDLLSELQNPGHQDWDPKDYPEWLLLEIENHILIRQEQAQIAREMISPSSGENSVMQLNMGLGKSSVIVPIAAAALADRRKLVRTIVLRPLLTQMFHLLVTKLGGMINRHIFYMPVSRSLKLSAEQALQIRQLYQKCMQLGGILLLQPEHILSFELLGLERLHTDDNELGKVMVDTQDWLRKNSRDILDESDEILSTRFELVYIVGTQRGIEFGPDRWIIIQYVLWRLSEASQEFQKNHPDGLEVLPTHPSHFPRIRILQTLVGEKLLRHVAEKLCENGLPGVSVCFFSPATRKTLLEFLTDSQPHVTPFNSLREAADDSESVLNAILLLRGLFGGGILAFAFEQKRWRVNYGLDSSRTMLAVPYHAKDSPTARSEFSHPDATLVLTCLSYYYGGLTDEQILSSFESLLQSDQAGEEYKKWVNHASSLPPEFTALTGVNLSNLDRCRREVFPPLRFARSVIDFYLSTIVFPAEMREFPHKLSSSGWDIAAVKTHPTTGFSGTNDSRYILPSSITQCDLPPQLPTNAAVLDCLLKPENAFEDMSSISPTGILNTEVLLNIVLKSSPPIRVILDVGAQVLELQNEELARRWLSQVPEIDAQAVIFFDSRNELCVLSRDGEKVSLIVSPFAKQMDQCLVYLDESHTRGTDLKMPTDYRALVTLGPKLTKDRLAQACMRMRKLGKGQSVAFCAPMEVQHKIRDYSGNVGNPIRVADVLKWCITETISNTRKSVPLWATQGIRHQCRQAAYSKSHADSQPISRNLIKDLIEPEAKSLQQRYGVDNKSHEEQILQNSIVDKLLSTRQTQLNTIRAKCKAFEVTTFAMATLHEEQERELSPENEREQQVELPPPAIPLEHLLHNDVEQLVTCGILDSTSNAFRPAFEVFTTTSASHQYDSAAWPRDLLVTKDFAQSIKGNNQLMDLFLRPVHWILSIRSKRTIRYVVISPYEAQRLLPSIRQSEIAVLHTYSARSSIAVRTLEDLAFCAIPAFPRTLPSADIIRQLNLFAGQLYLISFKEYESLCKFLGLCSSAPGDDVEVGFDGFILPTTRVGGIGMVFRGTSFTTSPMDFIRMILTMRRKGQSFTNSHLGKMLNRQLLEERDFPSKTNTLTIRLASKDRITS
ncbi:hypothetical protein F5884DRAFT_880995 [Xylogone sp. PMI_703]|nr:hypothetical protein F5884DRAFT_880995 [Xylogone sp. PMI_703]